MKTPNGRASEISELTLGELRRTLAFFAAHDREFFYQNNIHECCEWQKKGSKFFAVIKNGQLAALAGLSFYDQDGNQTFYFKAEVAVLTNAYVFPNFRQCGYHRLLIEHRLKFCLQNALFKIRALVKDGNNQPAKNLQNSGFVYSGHYDHDNVNAEIYVYVKRWRIAWVKIANFLRAAF